MEGQIENDRGNFIESVPFTRSVLQQNENTVELQWLEVLWNQDNMFETGTKFELMSVNHSAKSGSIIGFFLRFSLTWR